MSMAQYRAQQARENARLIENMANTVSRGIGQYYDSQAYEQGATQQERETQPEYAQDESGTYSEVPSVPAVKQFGLRGPDGQTQWRDTAYTAQERRGAGLQSLAEHHYKRGDYEKGGQIESQTMQREAAGLALKQGKRTEAQNEYAQQIMDISKLPDGDFYVAAAKLATNHAPGGKPDGKAFGVDFSNPDQPMITQIVDGKSVSAPASRESVTAALMQYTSPQAFQAERQYQAGRQDRADTKQHQKDTLAVTKQHYDDMRLKYEADAKRMAAAYGNKFAPQVFNTSEGVVTYNPNTNKWLDADNKPVGKEVVNKVMKASAEGKPLQSGAKVTYESPDGTKVVGTKQEVHDFRMESEPKYAEQHRATEGAKGILPPPQMQSGGKPSAGGGQAAPTEATHSPFTAYRLKYLQSLANRSPREDVELDQLLRSRNTQDAERLQSAETLKQGLM